MRKNRSAKPEGKGAVVQTDVRLRLDGTTYCPLLSLRTSSFGEAIECLSKINLDAGLLRDFRLGARVRRVSLSQAGRSSG